MKIGILTYHCVTNFGAQLQCLSTIGYLKKHGYEPIVINWWPKDLEEFYLREVPRIQYDEQMSFAQREMPLTCLCRTIEDVCIEIEKNQIEAVFLGSDALFDYFPKRHRQHFDKRKLRLTKPHKVACNHDLPNPFWGSFNDIINTRVPYCGFSISSQNSPYHKLNNEEKAELKRLLLNFKGLTVRDEWTKNFVTSVSGRNDVFVTPDPVFAFNDNTDFHIRKEELLKKYNLPSNYILISFCQNILSDDFVNNVIQKVEKETGASCVSFPMPRRLRQFDTKYSIELPLPTLDWYYLIKYSNGYIGELMHPIIVSLHNSVPFFCFDQYGTEATVIPLLWRRFLPKSSKIYDILRLSGLLDNMCPYARIKNLTPEIVVDNFLKFDKEKCAKFADDRYKKYKEGMSYVLKTLGI